LDVAIIIGSQRDFFVWMIFLSVANSLRMFCSMSEEMFREGAVFLYLDREELRIFFILLEEHEKSSSLDSQDLFGYTYVRFRFLNNVLRTL